MRKASAFALACMGLIMSAQGQAAAPSAPGTPAERLRHAAELSALDAVKSRPWHLMLDVTVIDPAKKTSTVGTIEMWRAGEDSRTSYAFGDATEVDLRSGGKYFRKLSGPAIPEFAQASLQQFLHPGPQAADIESSSPELRRETLGKDQFDCNMLSTPIKHLALAPPGLFPTYCLLRDTDDLRVSYNFGSQTVVRRTEGSFLDHTITTSLTLSEGKVEVATARVTKLSTFTPAADEFKLANDMSESGTGLSTKISGGVLAGQIVTKVPPVYPASARANHVSGTVVLRALIGEDGRIHSLQLKSAGDPDLAVAAIAAARQWRYKPYLLNGVPTEVDSTITMNFNLSP